ncbi:hypothetical protein DDZ14_01130 [Maritimibacter sp. 55A14]|uniref:FAD:protein FMN transferase n=1 Tax=Maritimibacter sp. 55A14 TaxID=2174844 RepID=UPI000D61F74D|nr:FAD:protein FMN transferase [Maritimibacter sp. 55A14]PWE34440.1 hypothetical protein DDZ14_01130 [Maritimibacter sp. 55A14]
MSQQQHQSRRRFIALSAAALAWPAGARAAAPAARWQGRALGAEASMVLAGVAGDEAQAIFADVAAEVARQEAIFSLHRAGSALAQLNRDGELPTPPPEMLELLGLCATLHRKTGGAFDPSVQPLWMLHARAAERGSRPDAAAVATARACVGFGHVRFGPEAVRFARPGMALTLNGIAQGYIADRISDLLRARGFGDVLVNMGEVVGNGRRPDGGPWQAGIAGPDGALVGRTALSDRALATSAPQGTLLDAAGRVGHIIDPLTGRPGGRWRVVSISAPRAALADGLSTAFCLMDAPDIHATLAGQPETRVETLI